MDLRGIDGMVIRIATNYLITQTTAQQTTANGMIPYTTFGIRAIAPGGTIVDPPPPPVTCTWVVGDWRLLRRHGRNCTYIRTVHSSVAGCTPADPMPATTKIERCA